MIFKDLYKCVPLGLGWFSDAGNYLWGKNDFVVHFMMTEKLSLSHKAVGKATMVTTE